MKSQVPNSTSQINSKFQIPNVWCLVFGAWCLFGAWDLVLGASEWYYDAKGRCDPFYSLVQEGKTVRCEANLGTGSGGGSGPSAPLKLGGILWDPGGHSIALINDAEVKRGDRVEGYEVADIRHDAVVLTRAGQQVVLQIEYENQAAHPPEKPGGSRGGKHP
jgi:hypothetical protein